MVQTTFTIWAAFHPIHKDVLHIFQQSNLIYKFKYRCNAIYIGCTSQHLEVRVKQHVPRDIRNHKTSGHSKLLDSTICEHLNALNRCVVNYGDECFVILHRARTKQHRIVLEAIYILFNSKQTPKSSIFAYVSRYLSYRKVRIYSWNSLSDRLANYIISLD